MTIKQLYKIFTQKIYEIANQTQDTTSLEELQTLLSEHSEAFEEQHNKELLFILFLSLLGAIFGIVLTQILDLSSSMIIFISVLAALIFSFLSFFLKEVIAYRVPVEVIFLKSILQRAWRLEYRSSEELWQKYASEHSFLNKGDLSNEVHCVVHGKTANDYDFTYFDYCYTIEVEEEVQKEDSDGEVYYETEYYEESYTESCLFIKYETDISLMSINAPLQGVELLKFSNIQLNHQAKIYATNPKQAYRLFSPIAQIALSDFYKRFPAATMEIDKRGVFINFCDDLNSVAPTVAFDKALAKKMESSYLVKKIEDILDLVCNDLMSSFMQDRMIQIKKENENA